MSDKKKNYKFDLDAALEEVAQKLRPSANAECGGSSLPSDAIHTTGVGICSCSCCSRRYFYTATFFGTCCFGGGTQIATPNGKIAIEKIKVGDKVYAYDVNENQMVVSEVYQTFVNTRPIGEVELEDGTKLVATAKHPFYLPETKKYLRVGDLKSGDLVLKNSGEKGKPVAIKRVVFQPDFGNDTVYNFMVKKFHNYYANDVLVHNLSIYTPSC